MRRPPSRNNCRPGVDPQNTLLIDTKHGRIVIKLRNDLAPKHAERIKQLAREKYYDNVPFHRVIAGFMAQTGDGAAWRRHRRLEISQFAGRVLQCAVQARHRRHGAGERPELGERQFFIMYADGAFLNGKYTVVARGPLRAWTRSTRSRKASRWPIPIA